MKSVKKAFEKKLPKIYSIVVILSILFISVGYAAFNTDLLISGEAFVRVESDIRIIDFKVIDKTNGAYETYNCTFAKDNINAYATLPNINSTITYQVTLKNTTGSMIKVIDIIEEINTNPQIKYTLDGLAKNDVFGSMKEEITFNIKFYYSGKVLPSNTDLSLSLNFNIEKYFEEIKLGLVTESLISFSGPEISDDTSYGGFVVNKQGNYYKDNSGLLEYATDKSLILDEDNMICILDLKKFQSIDDAYSVYVTVRGDTNQVGYPTGGFAATILAVSEANTRYLTWFGFYNNYFNIHSYYNGSAQASNVDKKIQGFSSFNVSEYSNKKINIQITATRGGTTSVYINGNLVNSFPSGTNKVSYGTSSIGDLREGRGLKFMGQIYDIAIYSKVLSEEEIKNNWNYAKDTWEIE